MDAALVALGHRAHELPEATEVRLGGHAMTTIDRGPARRTDDAEEQLNTLGARRLHHPVHLAPSNGTIAVHVVLPRDLLPQPGPAAAGVVRLKPELGQRQGAVAVNIVELRVGAIDKRLGHRLGGLPETEGIGVNQARILLGILVA